jgi:hypothetical protein
MFLNDLNLALDTHTFPKRVAYSQSTAAVPTRGIFGPSWQGLDWVLEYLGTSFYLAAIFWYLHLNKKAFEHLEGPWKPTTIHIAEFITNPDT